MQPDNNDSRTTNENMMRSANEDDLRTLRKKYRSHPEPSMVAEVPPPDSYAKSVKSTSTAQVKQQVSQTQLPSAAPSSVIDEDQVFRFRSFSPINMDSAYQNSQPNATFRHTTINNQLSEIQRLPMVEQFDSGGGSNESSSFRDMAIRVVVRKRPLSKQEIGRGERDVMEIERGGQIFVHEPKIKVILCRPIIELIFSSG